jgi:hypothetical protein
MIRKAALLTMILGIAIALGFAAAGGPQEEDDAKKTAGGGAQGSEYKAGAAGGEYLRQSPGASAAAWVENDFGLGESYITKLLPYPPGRAGDRTPFDLWRYGGRGDSSWGSPVLPMPFAEWIEKHREQKPILMAAVRAYMESRYAFSAEAVAGAFMSGGKPIMKGPVARAFPAGSLPSSSSPA